MEEIVIKNKRSFYIIIILAFIVCIGLCITLLNPMMEKSNDKFLNEAKVIVGYGGIVFFTIAILVSIYKFFNPKEILRISKNGFTECFSKKNGIDIVPWDAVVAFKVVRKHGETIINVKVGYVFSAKDPNPNNISALINKKLGLEGINIRLSYTKSNPNEVVKLMEKYHQEYIFR